MCVVPQAFVFYDRTVEVSGWHNERAHSRRATFFCFGESFYVSIVSLYSFTNETHNGIDCIWTRPERRKAMTAENNGITYPYDIVKMIEAWGIVLCVINKNYGEQWNFGFDMLNINWICGLALISHAHWTPQRQKGVSDRMGDSGTHIKSANELKGLKRNDGKKPIRTNALVIKLM